jgi:arylsulfatase A-like enzyme
MRDVLLVTLECVRWDRRGCCPVFEGLDVVEAAAPGSFTRPSLAGLLSGQVGAAVAAETRAPTLPRVLSRAGYATAAIAHSPQLTPAFGFDDGFGTFDGQNEDSGVLARGSTLRERVARIGPVRRLYRRFQPKNATLSALPRDETVIKRAHEWWVDADSPRFLWLHLMGSHRPYGWSDPLPAAVGREAASAGPGDDVDGADVIVEHYERALQRVGQLAQEAVRDTDAIVAVAGDHGEELGEQGYWFHAPYRRRVVDQLARVPLGVRGLSIDGVVGLVGLPRLLCDAVGVPTPEQWATVEDRVTVAPWAGKASVRVATGGEVLCFSDGVASVSSTAGKAVDRQLEALGYV